MREMCVELVAQGGRMLESLKFCNVRNDRVMARATLGCRFHVERLERERSPCAIRRRHVWFGPSRCLTLLYP